MGKGGVVGAVVAWCRQRRRSLIRGLYSSSDSSASKSTTAGSGCAKDGPGAGLEAVSPSGSEAAHLGEALKLDPPPAALTKGGPATPCLESARLPVDEVFRASVLRLCFLFCSKFA